MHERVKSKEHKATSLLQRGLYKATSVAAQAYFNRVWQQKTRSSGGKANANREGESHIRVAIAKFDNEKRARAQKLSSDLKGPPLVDLREEEERADEELEVRLQWLNTQ